MAYCMTCGGDGELYKSLYGGNDPDVWYDRPCEDCHGTGNQYCEHCGDMEANQFLLGYKNRKVWVCDTCFDKDINDEEDIPY